MSDTISDWLRQQRLARGWSVSEMGRRLHRAAKDTGDHTIPAAAIVISYIHRWEKGKTGLTERYRLHYCTALGIQPSEFSPRGPHDESAQPTVEMAGPAAHDEVRGGLDSPASPLPYGGYGEFREERNITERPVPAPAAFDRFMATLAEESLDFGEWVGMTEVADATIEQYASQVRRLSRDFEKAPPLPLLLETKRLRDRVAFRLRGHQRLGQARDLYLIGAQVCGLLAWMSGDLGSYRAADTHAWTAWMCADQAGHDGARAWVRATQAKLAYWDGRFSESAQLAEDGLRYRCTDTARAFLALFHARALAKAGLRGEARQALARAEAEREGAADSDLIGGVWGLTAGRFHGLAASTRLLLDDPAQALVEATQAVELSESAPAPERHLYSEMLARIDQADAHLRPPDLDAASAVLRPVLDLDPDIRIDPVIQRLSRLRPTLTAPGLAGARRAQQLQEEIETFCGEAIPRQLSA